MAPPNRHRSTALQRAAAERSGAVARRIGIGLRESRTSIPLSQARASALAGISQSGWSRIERGLGGSVTIATLAACAAAVDAQLAGFIEARPGSSLPRDRDHLRRQQLLITVARPGGWIGRPEVGIDPLATRSRSIDVLLDRRDRAELAVVEIEDLVGDGGAAFRNLADKTAAIRASAASGTRVRGLLVLRATARNRQTVQAFADVFAARFPGSSATWHRALSDPRVAMPDHDGLLWSSVSGDRVFPVRLGRR